MLKNSFLYGLLFILSTWVLTCQLTVFAQKRIPLFDTLRTPVYVLDTKIEVKDSLQKKVFLNMPYGSPRILNSLAIVPFRGYVIKQIDLVYTDHPVGANLTQLTLNRLKALEAVCPTCTLDSSTLWRLVIQTDCPSQSVAQSHPHGFYLHYSKQKLSDRKNTLAKKETTKSSIMADTSATYRAIAGGLRSFVSGKSKFADSVVLSVFRRNQWNKMLIVADITGSMYPYIGHLLYWLVQNNMSQRMSHIVFFNDGNGTEDRLKRAGMVGGFHHTSSNDVEEIIQKASTGMIAGNGGDIPENNLEAVLFGLTLCDSAQHIVMIADNKATPRDLSLSSQLNRPMRIILCNTEGGINTAYMNLARETKSTLHTIEADILDLESKNEGDILVIRRKRYKFTKNRFVLLK